MSLSRWSSLAALAALTMACSSDSAFGPSGRLDHAAATFACGPADGPAVAIYLAPDPITSIVPSGNYVRVYLIGTVEEVRGKIQPVGPQSDAGVWFYPSGGDPEGATSGYLIINAGASGQSIAGTVDATFPDAGHLHTTFNADWVSTGEVCA